MTTKEPCYQRNASDPCYQPNIELLLDQSINCFCKTILDFAHVGLLVAVPDGTIKYMNPTFAKMFNIDLPSALNTNICNYFPNSKLLPVMQHGKPDIGIKFSYMGQDALISRYPIWNEGKIIGGLIEVYFRDISELSDLIRKMNTLEQKVRYYERKSQGLPGAKYTFDDIIGQSPAIINLKKKGQKFAQSSQPVLILGESGSGKELVAHSIHSDSLRSMEIFVSVNCAAIPQDLLEAELFGYEDGTFTGARRGGKVGKFELADRGTIFLDKIGELPLGMQAKLLRVIENKEIQKIGKSTPVYSDFRLVAATNKDLASSVESGHFREDLFHRLNTLVLKVPPLRERPEDIPLLAQYALDTMDDRPHQMDLRASHKVKELFRRYAWPGNIRELKNVISFAVLSMEEGASEIFLRHLPPYIIEKGALDQPAHRTGPVASLNQAREKTEKDAIIGALRQAGQNKSQAAKLLGISRNELYKKIRKHGLTNLDLKASPS